MFKESAWTDLQDLTSEVIKYGTGGMYSGEDVMEAGRVAFGMDTGAGIAKTAEVLAAEKRLEAIRAVMLARQGEALPAPALPFQPIRDPRTWQGGTHQTCLFPVSPAGGCPNH